MTEQTIGILLFDGAEELDFVGPFEVFTMLSEAAKKGGYGARNNVVLISQTGEDIVGAKGMRIGVEFSIDTAPKLDVLCIPGGNGTRIQIRNKKLLDWVAQTAAQCTWVSSVCTGSFVLAAAGLTENKNITTHWAATEEFFDLGLKGNMNKNIRYVVDGNLVTSAGVSAGIDMALWLTGQMHSIELARATQRAMEYDPAPPYSD
jgi:transcriptional regulator GlxA family with amidase domain